MRMSMCPSTLVSIRIKVGRPVTCNIKEGVHMSIRLKDRSGWYVVQGSASTRLYTMISVEIYYDINTNPTQKSEVPVVIVSYPRFQMSTPKYMILP